MRGDKSGGLHLMPAAGAVVMLLLQGCGQSDSPAPQAAPAAAAPAPAAQPVPAPAAAPTVAAAAPRSSATKWIGGIPYDVFYDRPLEIAADQTLLATAAATPGAPSVPSAPPVTGTPAPSPSPAPAGPAASTGSPGQVDWAVVAPIEQIVEEITSIRNDLQTKLNTLASYNQSWETIGVDATALAALAGVVELNPGEVSWKANAKVVRTLASDINAGATKTGRTPYDATKAPFDSLVDLLGGNPPADVEAEDKVPFADYADRSVLMARLEATHTFLKSNITTQERLEEKPAEVKRKLTVLATLMSIVTQPSYDSTAEPDYQAFSKRFVDAALGGRDAVDAKDLATFSAAVSEMQKICGECHQKYAFGGDGSF